MLRTLFALCPIFLFILHRLLPLVVEDKLSLPAFPARSRLTLLTAHPDDESMFFGPLLYSLRAAGLHLDLICLSNGSADGLGQVRTLELAQAVQVLGIDKHKLTVRDTLVDGFSNFWTSQDIARVLSDLDDSPDRPWIIFTFDQNGVSGHPNHRACFAGCLELAMSRLNLQVWALESLGLWQKYLGPWNLFGRLLPTGSLTFGVSSLRAGSAMSRLAMTMHASQMTWFRHLYVHFSSYMYMNLYSRVV